MILVDIDANNSKQKFFLGFVSGILNERNNCRTKQKQQQTDIILYFIYPGSCGVKLATNRCAPSARTEDVTRPPLTKISKLPEPAWDPSTKMIKYLLFTGDHCREMHVLHTFEFNRSSDSTVWYVLNTNRPST